MDSGLEGDPLILRPKLISYDLTPLATDNDVVRLRFAQVDNRSFFRASVDDIRIGESAPVIPDTITVDIDIQTNSDTNSINSKSNGKIKVAVLSASGFDATTAVDQGSITFGWSGDEPSLSSCKKNYKDVNNDGLLDLDLLCNFNTNDTHFQVGDTQGFLKAQTVDGTPIEGSDSVTIK